MNTFDIDSEIDRLVEKFSEELRTRLKKVVARSEKLVLKQYISSQKTTGPKRYDSSLLYTSKQKSSMSRSPSRTSTSRKGAKNTHIRYKDKDENNSD